jgi:hypothetical protein
LVEAAWHYQRRPGRGADLQRRQEGVDQRIIDISSRCQHRLYRLPTHLRDRGKPVMSIPGDPRDGLMRAWLEILRERHPEVTWIAAAAEQDGPTPASTAEPDRAAILI